MKTSSIRLAIVIVVVALAAVYLLNRYTQPSKRAAAVARCMEGGDGDTFTSRQLCEERYAPSAGGSPPPRNSN